MVKMQLMSEAFIAHEIRTSTHRCGYASYCWCLSDSTGDYIWYHSRKCARKQLSNNERIQSPSEETVKPLEIGNIFLKICKRASEYIRDDSHARNMNHVWYHQCLHPNMSRNKNNDWCRCEALAKLSTCLIHSNIKHSMHAQSDYLWDALPTQTLSLICSCRLVARPVNDTNRSWNDQSSRLPIADRICWVVNVRGIPSSYQ